MAGFFSVQDTQAKENDRFSHIDPSENNPGKDYVNHINCSTKAEGTSYLPAWVLESRRNLEASQHQHRQVEKRISNLQEQVEALSIKCEESLCLQKVGENASPNSGEIQLPPSEISPSVPPRSKYLPEWFLDSARQLEKSKEQSIFTQRRLSELNTQVAALTERIESCNSRQDQLAKEASFSDGKSVHSLPQQALLSVVAMMTVSDLLNSSATCTSAQKRMAEEWVWYPLFAQLLLPNGPEDCSSVDKFCRKAVVSYWQSKQAAIAFIRLLSQTPLEPADRTSRVGQLQFGIKPIRNQKDMRQVTLEGLQGLVAVTANPCDHKTSTTLRNMDAIKILMTVLNSAESGRIQELACCALANLLCDVQPVNAKESDQVMYGEGLKKAFRQLQSFDWKKTLIGLLSSPNASLTVCHGSRLDGTYLSSTRCQAMASKHASRVLLNWWSQPDQQILMGMEEVDDHSSISKPEQDMSCEGSVMPSLDGKDVTPLAPGYLSCKVYTWIALYFYSSGIIKDESPLRLVIDQDGVVTGSGVDNVGNFTLSGTSDTMGGKETCWLLYKKYDNSNLRVSHISYWCQGKGMWGVWEMKTGRSEFKLQKGGVFRLIPSVL